MLRRALIGDIDAARRAGMTAARAAHAARDTALTANARHDADLTSFGDGGRQRGQFFAVHSIATDSKGNLFTTETYGRRLQKFVYRASRR